MRVAVARVVVAFVDVLAEGVALVLDRVKSVLAIALVAAVCVLAIGESAANVGIGGALVYIATFAVKHRVSLVTCAFETAVGVVALRMSAACVKLDTFVNILALLSIAAVALLRVGNRSFAFIKLTNHNARLSNLI